jgi:hypothetical protein
MKCNPQLTPIRKVVTLDSQIARHLLGEIANFTGAILSAKLLAYLAAMESGRWDAKPHDPSHAIEITIPMMPLLTNGTHRMMAISCASVPVDVEIVAPPEIFDFIEEIRAELTATAEPHRSNHDGNS